MLAVDKVFILSTPGHAEKKQELFRKRLDAIALVPTGTDIEVLPASDDLSALHYQAWQTAVDGGRQSILVLEENFLPTANHYQVLDTDEPWDMIYLGRVSHGADMPLEGGLVKPGPSSGSFRSEEHTSELQSRRDLVCRLLLEKKKNKDIKQ